MSREDMPTYEVAVLVVATVTASDKHDAENFLEKSVHELLASVGTHDIYGPDAKPVLRLPDVPNWDGSYAAPVVVHGVAALSRALHDGWVAVDAQVKRR